MCAKGESPVEPKRLLIIGNGFDLNCGLKSTFEDFISKTYGDNTEPSYPLDSIDQANYRFKEKVLRTPIREKRDIHNWIPILARKNMWAEWLTFLRCCQKSTNNWADVESQMTILLTNKTVERALKQDNNVFNSDMSGDPDEVYYFLVLMLEVWGDTNLIDHLRSELLNFENAIMEYMRQQMRDNQHYFTKVDQLLSELTKLGIKGDQGTKNAFPEAFNLLNFNYTNVSTALCNGAVGMDSGLYPIVQRNIHGTTEEHAVIGIDATDVQVDSPIVLFTKTYRLLEKQEIGYEGKTNAVLSPEIHTIVFYGHSLSNNDFAYFQSIFDVYHVYDSKVLLIFAYCIYDQTEEMHIKERLYHAIQKLLDRYGRSLGNENHRQNLMHRLIIENRLLLKRV